MEQVAAALEKVDRNQQVMLTRLDERTAPNSQTQIAFAAVILTVVAMVASPCGFWVYEKFQSATRESDKLDERLQREFRQINETTLERINTVDRLSVMRHDEAILLTGRNLARIERLEDWNTTQIKADLEELRQRRMKTP